MIVDALFLGISFVRGDFPYPEIDRQAELRTIDTLPLNRIASHCEMDTLRPTMSTIFYDGVFNNLLCGVEDRYSTLSGIQLGDASFHLPIDAFLELEGAGLLQLHENSILLSDKDFVIKRVTKLTDLPLIGNVVNTSSDNTRKLTFSGKSLKDLMVGTTLKSRLVLTICTQPDAPVSIYMEDEVKDLPILEQHKVSHVDPAVNILGEHLKVIADWANTKDVFTMTLGDPTDPIVIENNNLRTVIAPLVYPK